MNNEQAVALLGQTICHTATEMKWRVDRVDCWSDYPPTLHVSHAPTTHTRIINTAEVPQGAWELPQGGEAVSAIRRERDHLLRLLGIINRLQSSYGVWDEGDWESVRCEIQCAINREIPYREEENENDA